MRIDPRFIGREARDAVGIQLLVLVGIVGGLALVVAGLRVGAWGSALGGGSFVLLAVSLRLSLFGRRRLGERVGETWGPDGVEIRIGLRPHRPLGLLCTSVGMAMLFGGGLFVTESVAGRVLMWLLLPLPLLLVPDCVRCLLTRGREVVLTPRALTYHGFSCDAEVPWEEITHVGTDRSNPWVPAIRFDLQPTTTVRAERHKMVAWLDPPPGQDNVQMSLLAVDMPTQLIELARRLIRMDLAERSVHLAREGMATLTDEARVV